MKTKRFTQLVIILALCTFALAACTSGTTNNTNNTNNANNTNNTAASPAANKNTTATPAPPAAKGDYSSPTAAFKSFYEAAKNNDPEGIKRSLSKQTMETMEQAAAEAKKPLDELFKDMTKGALATSLETRNEKIDGDNATLEVKDGKMDKWDSVPFVKEDGLWKISMNRTYETTTR